MVYGTENMKNSYFVLKYVISRYCIIEEDIEDITYLIADVSIQSTLGFATMDKAANLGLATRKAATDLF